MASVEAMKKPTSAYFLWFNAKREEIQRQVGSKDFKSVGSKASELWKVASDTEKRPFELEAQKQKDAFEKFKATPEGQKALEEKKADKKEEKKALEEKNAEKLKAKEEKQVAKDKREAKAAIKSIDKDERLKKPLGAYFAWLNDNRERITKLLGKGGAEVTKKGSEMWKALPEKDRKVYEDKAKKEKEAHDAYLKTPEGAAALKAYKDAADAVAYKEPKKTASEEEGEEEKEATGGRKRKADVAAKGGNAGASDQAQGKKAKSAKAGA